MSALIAASIQGCGTGESNQLTAAGPTTGAQCAAVIQYRTDNVNPAATGDTLRDRFESWAASLDELASQTTGELKDLVRASAIRVREIRDRPDLEAANLFDVISDAEVDRLESRIISWIEANC